MSRSERPSILVFGANGQVGRALINTLKSNSVVTALTRESTPSCDLATPESLPAIIKNLNPDIVINAAAYTAVDKAESEPELARLVNAKAPSDMGIACAKLDIPLIHYSTDYVFDGNKSSAYVENDTPCPINVYGQTKWEGEQGIQNSGCRHFILRTSWVYDSQGKNFLNTMLRLAHERDTLSVVNDQYGSPSFAGYVAQETGKLVDKILQGCPPDSGTFHLTCEGETNWHDFAKEIFQQSVKAGILKQAPILKAITTQSFPTPAIRPKRSTLNNSKAQSAWGKQPLEWKVALSHCLKEAYQAD